MATSFVKTAFVTVLPQHRPARAGIATLLPRTTDPGDLHPAKIEQVIAADTLCLRIDIPTCFFAGHALERRTINGRPRRNGGVRSVAYLRALSKHGLKKTGVL